ncbi:hypothetical protein MIR68_010243 [Amoeboaphelidium protococcarum]|nr:hypothetical protein MIR68_010243 [Amoeboaphelidium protococcarum]
MWNRFPFSILQLLLALSLVIFNKVYGTTGVNSEPFTNNQGNRLLLDEDEVAAVDHVLSQYYKFQPLNSVRHIIEEHVNQKDSLVAVLPDKCSFLVGLSVTPPSRRDQQTGGGGVDALELKMNFELQCAGPSSAYYSQQYYQSEDGTRLDQQQSSAHQSPSPSDDGSFEETSMTFDLIVRLSTSASSPISSAVNQRLYEASRIQMNALKRPLGHYPFSRSLFRSSEEVSHLKQQLQVQQLNHRHLEQQQLQQQFGNNNMQQQQVNDRTQGFQMRRSSSIYAENSQRAESYSQAYQQQQPGAAGMTSVAADIGARPLAARRRWTPRFAKPMMEQQVKSADAKVQQDAKQSQPVSDQKQPKMVVDNNVHMDIVFKTLALSTGKINIQYGDFAIIMTRNLIQLSDQCKFAFSVRGHVLQVNMFYIGKSSRGDDVNGSSSNSLVSLLSSSAKSMSSLKSQSQSQNSQWWPKRSQLSAGTLFGSGGGDGTAPFGMRRNGGSSAEPVRGQIVEDRTPRGQSPQVQSYMLRDESRLMDVSFAAAGFSFPDQRYERHYKKAFVDFIRKAANPSMQYYGLSLVQVAEEVRLKIKNFQDLANYNFDIFHDHPASLFSVDEVDQSQEQDAGNLNGDDDDDGFRDEDRIYLGLYFMLGSDLYNHLQKLQMLDNRAGEDGYGAQQRADLHDSGSLDGSLNLKLLPFIASNVKWEIPTMKAKFQPLAKDSYGMRTFQNALALYYQSKSVVKSKLENARKSELNGSRRRHTGNFHSHQRAGSFDGSRRDGTDVQNGQRRGFFRNIACGIKSASIRFLNSKLGTVLVTLGIMSAAQSMCNRSG